MGQWFKRKKKNYTEQVLEDNVSLLKEKIERLTVVLYNHYKDTAFRDLEEVFKTSLLIQLAETNLKATTGLEKEYYSYQRGRLDALGDVVEFFGICQQKNNHDLLMKKFKPTNVVNNGRVLGLKGKEGE